MTRSFVKTDTVTQNEQDVIVKKTKEEAFTKWMQLESLEEIPHPGRSLVVEGTIPPYVKGTYVKNGPGTFSDRNKNRRFQHAFDGLAKLQKFAIQEGDNNKNEVVFTCRFVDSLVKKAALGPLSVLAPCVSVGPVVPPFPSWQVLLTAAFFDNTPVHVDNLSSSGTFVALTDAAVKMEFDLETLETKGRLAEPAIEGVQGLVEISTAHGKTRGNATYNYYLEIGLDGSLWAHLVRTHTTSRTSIGKVRVEKVSYVHDVSITDNYAILCRCPLYLDFASMTNTEKGILQTCQYDPTAKSLIHVFDLKGQPGSSPVATFETEAFFHYHHVNAYEDNNKIVLDILAYPNGDQATSEDGFLLMENMLSEERRLRKVRESSLWRWELDLSEGASREVVPDKKIMRDDETGLEYGLELATVSPKVQSKPYRYAYGFNGFYRGTKGFLDWSIVKQDVVDGSRNGLWHEEFSYPGEPIFVPDPDGTKEDDGVLLCSVYDGQREENYLLVLDASTMKEVARAYTGMGL